MIDGFDLGAFVAATLAEDMGTGGDRTSAAVIPADAVLTAVMDSRDAVTVAGLPIAAAFSGRSMAIAQSRRWLTKARGSPPGPT